MAIFVSPQIWSHKWIPLVILLILENIVQARPATEPNLSVNMVTESTYASIHNDKLSVTGADKKKFGETGVNEQETDFNGSSTVFAPSSDAFFMQESTVPQYNTTVLMDGDVLIWGGNDLANEVTSVTEEDQINHRNKLYFDNSSAANEAVNGKLLSQSDLDGDNTAVNFDMDHNLTTERSLGFNVFKWGLIAIGVIVLVPLVLLPVLFLFAHGQSDGAPPVQHGDFKSISNPIALHSTAPNVDPYLVNHSAWANLIQTDAEHPYYWLTPNKVVVISKTGQLLHPNSGLLFNPIEEYKQQNGPIAHPKPNQVYDPVTRRLYERCLSLALGTDSNGQAKWSLADSAAGVRRVEPNELPSSLVEKYNQLLSEWQQKQNEASPQEAVTCSQHQPLMSELVANPLLLTKRDFTKMNHTDTKQTPRGSSKSKLFKLEVAPLRDDDSFIKN